MTPALDATTRDAWLAHLTLSTGGHAPTADEWCVMEATAYVAGEPHSDEPVCVSRVLTSFSIGLNDRWSDEQRQKLIPFIPRLIGTRDDGLDETRGYLALDWLIRTYTPAWLDLAGLGVEAAELRALRRIADQASAEVAGPVVRQAREKAAAAWDAAGAAARDAAWDAARAALCPTVEELQASALDLLDRMIDGRWTA